MFSYKNYLLALPVSAGRATSQIFWVRNIGLADVSHPNLIVVLYFELSLALISNSLSFHKFYPFFPVSKGVQRKSLGKAPQCFAITAIGY